MLFGVYVDEIEIFFIDGGRYGLSFGKNNPSFILLESWLLDIEGSGFLKAMQGGESEDFFLLSFIVDARVWQF